MSIIHTILQSRIVYVHNIIKNDKLNEKLIHNIYDNHDRFLDNQNNSD